MSLLLLACCFLSLSTTDDFGSEVYKKREAEENQQEPAALFVSQSAELICLVDFHLYLKLYLRAVRKGAADFVLQERALRRPTLIVERE